MSGGILKWTLTNASGLRAIDVKQNTMFYAETEKYSYLWSTLETTCQKSDHQGAVAW